MSEAWGVTRHEPNSTEGITVIELFATENLASLFLADYVARSSDPYRMYGVTHFHVWEDLAPR